MSRTVVIAAALALGLAAPALAAAPALNPSGGAWARNGAVDTSQGSVVDQGKAVFQNRCAACHSRASTGMTDIAGTRSLDAKYQGAQPGALEDRTDLTPEVVRFFVRNGIYYMPQFRKTYISDKELDALAAYLTRAR